MTHPPAPSRAVPASPRTIGALVDGKRFSEHWSIPELRSRVNAITADVLLAVERDGVMGEGGVHPLLPTLVGLLTWGTDTRRLANERWAVKQMAEER